MPLRRFQARANDGQWALVTIDAKGFYTENGTLVFFDEKDRPFKAFCAKDWARVTEVSTSAPPSSSITEKEIPF